MDRCQRDHAAGRHRFDGVVVRLARARADRRRPAGQRPAAWRPGLPLAAISREVLLGRLRSHPSPDSSRHRGGSLRRGWRRLLRCQAGGNPALQHRADVAHAAGDLLDRHRVAGGGSLHRPGDRPRAEVPGAGRQRAVRGAAGRRARVDGRRVAEHQAVPRQRRRVVLLRPQRLRVHRPRQVLPGGAARRAVHLAVPDAARFCRR